MKSKILTIPVEIIREEDEKGYYVVVPALPGCFSQGRTIEEANKNIREAIILHLREMRRSGQSLPRQTEFYQTTIQVAA